MCCAGSIPASPRLAPIPVLHNRNEDGMSKYVTITGDALEYFKNLVRLGLQEEYGTLSEVRVVINDERGMMFGVNGYSSDYFGTVTSDPEPDSANAQIIESIPAVAEDVSTNGHREPEILGDILNRMFPGLNWNVNVHNTTV